MATNLIALFKAESVPVPLSESACEGRPEKWKERRAILARQKTRLELVKRGLDAEIERVTQRLDNCDEALATPDPSPYRHVPRYRPVRADRSGGGVF